MPHCCLKLFISFVWLAAFTYAEDFIIVNKNHVVHKFVPFDGPTDHFLLNVFSDWEEETFKVFERCKNDQGIAIDIGAWIGTTAIWLSKNFYHVLAIEADKVSISCLEKNLHASECANVTLCPKAISDTSQKIIFGPRGANLNDSISHIKKESNSENDYIAQSSTFKQILYENIFSNEKLSSHKISFIKCDIEGGEESVLEDILHFAYYNDCKAYISFHLDWWGDKNIERFEKLFGFFRTNCPEQNISQYLRKNPFASILFKPRKKLAARPHEIFTKGNIPAVIIGYNQLTYIRNMVNQLEKYTSDIIVIDNKSDYKPLLDYYEKDFKYTLLKMDQNYGHTVFRREPIQKLVGDLYILTDPDLQFNPNLPDHFLQELINISYYFQANRVGFALLIDADDLRPDVKVGGLYTIKQWESEFWKDKLYYFANPKLELYSAGIDTTFCLVNRRFPDNSVRVAGDYTCKHLPWHINFQDQLQPGEYGSYLQNNKSTNWFQ